MAEADVLLPEEEGVAVGVAGEPQARVVTADGSDFLNGFNEVRGVTQAVEVERELSVFDGLCCGDCTEKTAGRRPVGQGFPATPRQANRLHPKVEKCSKRPTVSLPDASLQILRKCNEERKNSARKSAYFSSFSAKDKQYQ